jgi:hypothetical protein
MSKDVNAVFCVAEEFCNISLSNDIFSQKNAIAIRPGCGMYLHTTKNAFGCSYGVLLKVNSLVSVYLAVDLAWIINNLAESEVIDEWEIS